MSNFSLASLKFLLTALFTLVEIRLEAVSTPALEALLLSEEISLLTFPLTKLPFIESPFSLVLEKLLKSTLQDYIKKDGLILDSFSFLDTNFRLKNVELKNQIKEINNISIELLNGIIYDINIEGSILQNKVNIELSNITICLYIPSIEELLYSYPKSKILKYDPCLQYSFKKNQINNLFSFLCGTNFVKIKMYNLSVNVFINIESVLVNLSIHIDNILWKTDYKENDELCTSYKYNPTIVGQFCMCKISLISHKGFIL